MAAHLPARCLAGRPAAGEQEVLQLGSRWPADLPIHNLAVIVGGVAEKPVIRDGAVVAREMLALTISFNHDIIDGAPAARFVRRLVQAIETPGDAAERATCSTSPTVRFTTEDHRNRRRRHT